MVNHLPPAAEQRWEGRRPLAPCCPSDDIICFRSPIVMLPRLIVDVVEVTEAEGHRRPPLLRRWRRESDEDRWRTIARLTRPAVIHTAQALTFMRLRSCTATSVLQLRVKSSPRRVVLMEGIGGAECYFRHKYGKHGGAKLGREGCAGSHE